MQYTYDFANGAREAGIPAFWGDNGNTDETGLLSFADASYAFPIIGLAHAAGAEGMVKPAMDAQVETEPEETQAPETEKATEEEKATEAEQETQQQPTEKKGGLNTTVLILLIVLGIVIVGAVVVLAMKFRRM